MLSPTERVLRTLATEQGGTIIASTDKAVGYSVGVGRERVLYKLHIVAGKVVLAQLSGAERGRTAEIATLSDLLTPRVESPQPRA